MTTPDRFVEVCHFYFFEAFNFMLQKYKFLFFQTNMWLFFLFFQINIRNDILYHPFRLTTAEKSTNL